MLGPLESRWPHTKWLSRQQSSKSFSVSNIFALELGASRHGPSWAHTFHSLLASNKMFCVLETHLMSGCGGCKDISLLLRDLPRPNHQGRLPKHQTGPATPQFQLLGVWFFPQKPWLPLHLWLPMLPLWLAKCHIPLAAVLSEMGLFSWRWERIQSYWQSDAPFEQGAKKDCFFVQKSDNFFDSI